MTALQALQQRGDIVFGAEKTTSVLGPKLSSVSATELLAADKDGLTFVAQADGKWQLQKEEPRFVFRLNPAAMDTPEVKTLQGVFHLKPGLTRFDITVEELDPFGVDRQAGETQLDLEPRSLLQALYFVAHGVEVRKEHLEKGLARQTKNADCTPYDWKPLLNGLFTVKSSTSDCNSSAHVAVEYAGHCFFIDATDHDTRATFSLLMELSRLQLNENTGARAPLLTIPVGGR